LEKDRKSTTRRLTFEAGLLFVERFFVPSGRFRRNLQRATSTEDCNEGRRKRAGEVQPKYGRLLALCALGHCFGGSRDAAVLDILGNGMSDGNCHIGSNVLLQEPQVHLQRRNQASRKYADQQFGACEKYSRKHL
jgi:hypothetical protein